MTKRSFRVPAVPLIAHDPLFSVWSFSDRLNEDVTRHWDGVRQFMFGFVAVDKIVYEFLGKVAATDERYMTGYRKLPQTGCEIRPMTTVYTFENEILAMTLTFTSPLLLNDLDILARPVTYIDYEITLKDDGPHDVDVQFGFSGELCVNETTQSVEVALTPLSIAFTSGTENMLRRAGDDHRIEWGSFHAVAPDYIMEAMSLRAFWGKAYFAYGSKETPINILPSQGPNRETWNPHPYEIGRPIRVHPEYPVILVRKELRGVSGTIRSGIAAAYDEVKAIQYFGENVDPYWKKDGDSFLTMVRKALDEHDTVLEKVAAFEDALLEKARKISEEYADILCLSYRQAIAGHKLTCHGGELQFISKENYSNGCAGTVDVTYPSLPLFLLYAPELVEGMLNPIFKMVDMGMWLYEFAPHDVGTYPLANGQTYGYSFRHRGRRPDPLDSQMPVEECGNMLLCVAAACFAKKDMAYFEKHRALLTQWADYLVKVGYDPDNQLCTDDFAGHLAHNCNLSAKAICALGAFALCLNAIDDEEGAARYDAAARSMAAKWEEAAFEGDHYRLAFDQKDTWSIKYNMVWDKLFGMDLFSQKVYDTELAWYKKQLHPYGIPLDCRGDCTKTDWEMWSTVLFDDKEYTDAVVGAMHRWITECVDRMPFPDLVFTSQPWMRAFVCRTVVGGMFINLLEF